MSSGGGSSPTPNRTCTGTVQSNVRLVLVYQPAYSLNGGNWQTGPVTSIAANSQATVFVANGQTLDGKVTYQDDYGTQFVLVFTMNGSNYINILANGGSASNYNYSVASPGTGDTITAVYTISRSNSQ